MNMKLKVLTAAILLGSSTAALSDVPTDVPPKYLAGPLSPFVDTTNLTAAERAAFAIYEGIMQITEGKISATSCAPFDATINIQTDGSRIGNSVPPIINGDQNYAKVTSTGGSFRIDAALQTPATGRGQNVYLSESLGTLDGTPVNRYNSTVVYNSVNNMMTVNNARGKLRVLMATLTSIQAL